MPEFDCLVISGASGAVGSYLVREFARTWRRGIHCVLREPASLERLRKIVGSEVVARVTPHFADLTDSPAVQALVGRIGRCGRVLAVHCAGDVSWTKSRRLVEPINVDGARNFAELVVAISETRPSLVFLSTAFCAEGAAPRNAYEATKQVAESLLRRELADRAYLATIKCSLVVGAQADGWIGRFNGIYPLVRILALAEVPCLIANRGYGVDTIPIDVVWRQIREAADRLSPEQPYLELVLAAGDQALPIKRIAELVVEQADRLRKAAGLQARPEISIITERQFRFLMAASKSWEMEAQFAKVEQISEIMAGYITHAGSGRGIQPQMLGAEAAKPSDYMPTVIGHWLAVNRARVLTDRTPEWLGEEGALA